MKKGFISILVMLSVMAVSFSGCAPDNEHRVNLKGSAQGTYYNITYYDAQNRNFHAQIDSILNAFDMSCSLWKPNSVISRVNRDDSTVVLDSNFIGNFNYSQEVSRATNGAFDMTVGPEVEVWGFGFENRENVTQHMVDSLKQFVGYQKIKIVDGKVIKADPRMQIDFNGIAQGYSDDVVARYLKSKGIENYLIDIGGEVVGHGRKPDGPWRVGIEKPAADADSPRTVKAVIALNNMSVATSGSYRKYYIKNGIRYSHTIDPATGYPVQHSLLSVSVLTNNTALADAYATAFMVMGYPKSRAFVESHPSMEAFFIWSGKDGKFHSYATAGFKKIILSDFK
ncbi:MAG: FAD:protein FMN transferase [Bacteroidales bacterium]|nr:FAD:protein FMN transferase [Bacteroidales bacterium]